MFITKVLALATFLCLVIISLIVFHVFFNYLYALQIDYHNVVFQLVVKYLLIYCDIFHYNYFYVLFVLQITYFCAL